MYLDHAPVAGVRASPLLSLTFLLGLTLKPFFLFFFFGQHAKQARATILRNHALADTPLTVIIALTIPNQPCHRAFPVCILHIVACTS